MSEIEWRDVLGYEGLYQVSSDGQIYGVVRAQTKKPQLHYTGFLGTNLTKNGETTYHLIHRLVVEAFYGISLGKWQVRFKDEDKQNLRLDNLLLKPSKIKVKRVRKSFEERFWSNVAVAGEDDCWLWTGGLNGGGYGSMGNDGRSITAHRASWQIHYGEIPNVQPRLVVMHKCDNPQCVNPHHLELGTYSDNIQDSIRKGRFKAGIGRVEPVVTEQHRASSWKIVDEPNNDLEHLIELKRQEYHADHGSEPILEESEEPVSHRYLRPCDYVVQAYENPELEALWEAFFRHGAESRIYQQALEWFEEQEQHGT